MTAPVQSLKGLDLLADIERLKRERNAVILAHYYQKPEIQDLADFVGDSLDLSRKAAATDADVIAFCGVRFMAETAKILSPEKTVILPDMDAGCSLEDSCPPDQFAAFRAAHPDHIALTYINCSAAVKALSDIIVTSSSAAVILDHADQIGSTKAILDAALKSPSETIIVATEPHIIHQMEKAAPHKKFIGAPGADGNCNCNMCPYMALNSMEKLYVALRDLQPRIEMAEELRLRARKSLDRMLDMAGRTVGQGDVGRPMVAAGS